MREKEQAEPEEDQTIWTHKHNQAPRKQFGS